jgi:hypothetical protein
MKTEAALHWDLARTGKLVWKLTSLFFQEFLVFKLFYFFIFNFLNAIFYPLVLPEPPYKRWRVLTDDRLHNRGKVSYWWTLLNWHENMSKGSNIWIIGAARTLLVLEPLQIGLAWSYISYHFLSWASLFLGIRTARPATINRGNENRAGVTVLQLRPVDSYLMVL